MSSANPTVGVIGAGAWGTALAQMLASDGRDVLLWTRRSELAEELNSTKVNSRYLPSATLEPSILATSDLAYAAKCDILLMVTPAQHLGETLAAMPQYPRDLVLCCKGIEARTMRMMAQVAGDAAAESEIAVLSGPTFAHEVAAGLPTAVTLACGGGDTQWERLRDVIARPNFRPYFSDDVIGAEVGGAIKNVLAIACGVVEGLELGQNARAALIARGYAEMMRLGDAVEASRETLVGLCGLGDLVLTCTSTSSRNFTLGVSLGQGSSAEDLMKNRHTVAEGAHTAPVLVQLAEKLGVSMPIAVAVKRLLEGAQAREVVAGLLARPLRAEGPSD